MPPKGVDKGVQVAVRVRPLMEKGSESVVHVDRRTGAVTVGGKTFTYPSSVILGKVQDQAFQSLAAGLIGRLAQGFNCTLLAYGQTGSGKTYAHCLFLTPPQTHINTRTIQAHMTHMTPTQRPQHNTHTAHTLSGTPCSVLRAA